MTVRNRFRNSRVVDLSQTGVNNGWVRLDGGSGFRSSLGRLWLALGGSKGADISDGRSLNLLIYTIVSL
jgi:hypothetical protein